MLMGFNWLSANHDFWNVFSLTEVVHVLSNEPDPCDTFVDTSFCICRFNGCVIAYFMNNRIDMLRRVELRAFRSQTACWF